MRVLKFGGTSLANAERFAGVADIIASNTHQGEVSTVLSAPAKITNALVAVVENTVAGKGVTVELETIRDIFSNLFQGLSEIQPNFEN